MGEGRAEGAGTRSQDPDPGVWRTGGGCGAGAVTSAPEHRTAPLGWGLGPHTRSLHLLSLTLTPGSPAPCPRGQPSSPRSRGLQTAWSGLGSWASGSGEGSPQPGPPPAAPRSPAGPICSEGAEVATRRAQPAPSGGRSPSQAPGVKRCPQAGRPDPGCSEGLQRAGGRDAALGVT